MQNDEDDALDLRRTLIDGLDRILHEIGRIDNALIFAPRAEDLGMVREARGRTVLLFDQANAFFAWVTDTRLNPPPN